MWPLTSRLPAEQLNGRRYLVANGHTYLSLGQAAGVAPGTRSRQHPHAVGVPYRRRSLRQPFRQRSLLGFAFLGRRFVSR